MSILTIIPSIKTLIPYLYPSIKDETKEKLIQYLLTGYSGVSHPTFIQIGGIPGAGKSTFYKNHSQDNYLYISFDAIMEQLPEYISDLHKIGSKASFTKWEIPARIIGYELLQRAITLKLNIILEHSGVNDAHIELIHSVKKLGYKTRLYFIICDIDVAKKRALARENITHRHTPLTLIENRLALVKKYLPIYINDTDEVSVFDTSQNSYCLLHHYKSGMEIK